MVLFLAVSISCTIQPGGEAISNDNVVIKYDVKGKGEPALVFIHCWCCDKSYWKYAGSYDVKFMKLVGHFIMLEDPFTFNKLLKETIGER